MLHLLTGNPRKYGPLADVLREMQITLTTPQFAIPELQDHDFKAVLTHKARSAAEAFGSPCLVDDSGLLLEAYPGFPGPLTSSVCRLLGSAGLARLVAGTTARAQLVCHLGCWAQGRLWHWQGAIAGALDPRRPVIDGPGPLAQWFVPDEPGETAVYGHRRRALEALRPDLERLRLAIAGPSTAEACAVASHPDCVFCREFDGDDASVYHRLLGAELPSRVIHSTPHFLVFPPLGEFIEGGLLLTTREHRLSMAHLPPPYYAELETLMAQIAALLQQRYGVRPLFFEHAPAVPGDKAACCVDHAHLNVFPAAVDVHRQLEPFPHAAIDCMQELAADKFRDQPYLFLQTNSAARYVYAAGVVPSQYIRRIITTALGMPERWHWRDYLGLDELKRTYAALRPWRFSHAADA